MKTSNFYFPSKNGKIDSELVRAIEALPPEDYMLIFPKDTEKVCLKKDGYIIIYPHDPKIRLFSYENINTKHYRELSSSITFKLDNFSYEVLNLNPIGFYDYIRSKGRPLFDEYYSKILKDRESK